MNKAFLKVAIAVVTVVLLAANAAFAAAEKRVDLGGSNYMTVSNVTAEQEVDSTKVLTATAPVKVTFYGSNLALESIMFSDGVRENGTVKFGVESDSVKFDVKKYTLFDDPSKVYDEYPEGIDEILLHAPGNYATLTKPGIYHVYAATEAVMPTRIAIEVVAEGSAVVTQPAAPAQEPAPAPKPAATATASATASKVLVNKNNVSFEAYNINSNNYFKLRDLAAALNGTVKNFEVGWDGEKNAISLASDKAYTLVGGELAVSSSPASKQALLSTAKVYLDGEEVELTAYTIGGNNYFKLRDIAKVLDIGVTWDAATSTIGIDTSISYTE